MNRAYVARYSYGINTEAPCSVIFDNRNGSNMINLAFATGALCYACRCYAQPDPLTHSRSVRTGNYYQSNYDTRIMYIDASLDPLTPSNWVQQAVPVLSSDSSVGVYGPGSGGFFEGRSCTSVHVCRNLLASFCLRPMRLKCMLISAP